VSHDAWILDFSFGVLMSTRLAVIGAGPGGYAAAFHAADMGMKVTLVDADPNPGGVCTFRGCIPSKALLHAAKVIEEAKHAEVFGMSFGKLSIDIAKLRGWKDAVVKKQTGGLGLLAKSRKVEFIQGRASIVDARTLSVETSGGERRVETDYIIIATGSRPAAVPGVSIDSPRVLDSTTALDLPDVPKRLLVVGGGYIGLELGTVYAALGSKVSVVEMGAVAADLKMTIHPHPTLSETVMEAADVFFGESAHVYKPKKRAEG
jgi:dihydrolipoyl dehydrogenase